MFDSAVYRSAAYAALLAALAAAGLLLVPRAAIPAHMVSPVGHDAQLLSEADALSLRRLMKGMQDFPTNVRDTSFYEVQHEHIGEARQRGADGR